MQQVMAGAFEAFGISGVSMASGRDVLGMRMAFPHPALGLYDDKDLLLALEAPEACSPDQGYVCYAWRVPVTASGVRRVAGNPRQGNSPQVFDFAPGEAALVVLEWSFDGTVVRGRYTVDRPLRAALVVNGCFRPATVTEATPTRCRLEQGEHALQLALSGKTEMPYRLDKREQIEAAWEGVTGIRGEKLACYPVALSPETPLYFTLSFTPQSAEAGVPAVDPAAIAKLLAEQAAAYSASRMCSTGYCPGGAEAVAALAGYSRHYDQHRQCLQTSVNRTWSWPNAPGCIFGWDNFFTSYIAAWEDPTLGAASLEHIIAVYAEHGLAGGPTQRNLIIPVLYCRTLDILGDIALARRTWGTMMAFMRFWFEDRGDGIARRDGNGDGLIESGTDMDPQKYMLGTRIQAAMDETGYDDFPLYSAGLTDGRRGLLADGVAFDRRTQMLTVTLVCQNSLYCASCRTMARWAERLGEMEDAAWLRAEADRVAARMRERLYVPEQSVYRDRYWNGDFSPVKVMTIFYPLLAGIAGEETKARLREMLLDPRQFWGENLMPTVSRDDPAYCDGLDGRGNYWRGNAWPPTTYIVYLAIKEAGWDDLAAEYARCVSAQFLEYWTRYGHAYENYPAEGKVDHDFIYPGCWGGREVRYVWSAMLPLCGLEEVFGAEAVRPGVHFGNPYLPEQTRWHNFTFAGQRIDAEAGPQRTHVRCGDAWEFTAEPGISVRAFTCEENRISFTAITNAPAQIRLTCHATEVTINGEAVAVDVDGETLAFHLPAGESQVEAHTAIQENAIALSSYTNQ